MLFLTTRSLWLSGLLLVGLPTPLAMVGPALVRRLRSLDRLSTNNEVAGFKPATVGVIYAVLLAFAVIVAWEKFSGAEAAVAQEAGAAAIYRLADGEDTPGHGLRDRLTDYITLTVDEDLAGHGTGRGEPGRDTRAGQGLRRAADAQAR
jgi:hypothetical protein